MNDFDVLVHGFCGVDYLMQLDGIAPPGEVRVIEREVRRAGGEAVNCARALASWGARVALMGNPIGDDPNGKFLRRELDGIENLTLFCPLPETFETPYSVVMTAPFSPRAILVRHQNADAWDLENAASTRNAEIPTALLATCDAHFSARSYALAKTLKERGTPLLSQDALLNESVAQLSQTVLLTDAFFPKSDEKKLRREAENRARAWNTKVIITRGDKGGVVCEPQKTAETFAAFPVKNEDAFGSIGAGDVFRAGLLFSQLREYSQEKSLRFASAAAALRCQNGDDATLGQIEAVAKNGAR